jgi:hypothetical protein
MTLKEKFHQWLKTEPFSSEDRPTLREAQCEVIAEEFAINFANWYEFMLRQNDNLNERFTPKELIQMFKKEKQL